MYVGRFTCILYRGTDCCHVNAITLSVYLAQQSAVQLVIITTRSESVYAAFLLKQVFDNPEQVLNTRFTQITTNLKTNFRLASSARWRLIDVEK